MIFIHVGFYQDTGRELAVKIVRDLNDKVFEI